MILGKGKEDRPGGERGITFRSLQVFKCEFCGAVTNKIILAGYPGYGPRAYCPNCSEQWHQDLEDHCERFKEPGHPKFYLRELKKEIKELKRQHKNKIENDIKGKPDFSLVEKCS